MKLPANLDISDKKSIKQSEDRVDLSIFIPTYNEEIHIERSIKSALKIAKEVFIVDSHSTDKTLEIAKKYDIAIFEGEWHHLGQKLNWAIVNLPIKTQWVMRLDADEYFTNELISEIKVKLPNLSNSISAVSFCRRIYFMGKWMKKGTSRTPIIRIIKKGKAYYENRWLDEHVIVRDGGVIIFKSDLVDDNLNNLTHWINKHNKYATLEAIELIDSELGIVENKDHVSKLDYKNNKKRKMKDLYTHMPLFIRPFLFFCYRYFFKLSFLEGKEAFIWDFMQCWWYRTLADAKVFEIYKNCGKDKNLIVDYIKKNYGIDCRNV